jgi:hypothetical protein
MAQPSGVLSGAARVGAAILLLWCTVLAAHAAETPAPVLTFDHTTAVPGSELVVRLWFTGEGTDKVNNVHVTMTGSDSVSMQPLEPPGAGQGPFALTLDVKKDSIVEGSANLVFDIRYDTTGEDGKVVTRRAVIEKPIELGLIAAGSVSGFPLQLVSLIVPGLFGVIVLRARKSTVWEWLDGAAEKVSGGLLLSLLAIWLLELVSPHIGMPELASPGITKGKLAAAMVVGACIAAGVVGLEWLFGWARQQLKERRDSARLLTLQDSDAVVVAKSIIALCEARDRTDWTVPIVAEKAGQKLLGSTVLHGIDGDRFLLGWWHVPAQEDIGTLLQVALSQSGAAGRKAALRKVAERLRKQTSTLEPEDQVRQLAPQSQSGSATYVGQRFRLDDPWRVRPALPEDRQGTAEELGAIPLRLGAGKGAQVAGEHDRREAGHVQCR